MAKINLDKYYTPLEISKHCIDVTFSKISNISEIIEPSAGNGSFSLQLENCLAYDLQPEHETIIKQDFLELNLEYKKNRLFIGNPPFGDRNSLSVKFFKKSIQLGDYVAFILPISQYQNNQQLYEFDLIHSEILPIIKYSGVNVACCFNIYQRPLDNLLNNSPINYELEDVKVLEYRRGGTYPIPINFDYGMCTWGSIGKELKYIGQYAQETYFKINNLEYKDEILKLIKETDWKNLYPSTTSPKIQTWKIYKYLKEQIPNLK